MIQSRKEKEARRSLALAFAIPCVGMLFVMLISGYTPFGSYSMLYSDMYHQYYPFFVEFRRALLEGKGLVYTWSIGMGMDYLGLIAYYLASPLNLLCVLVPEKWLLLFFSLLMPIKLGFAGLFFAVFLQKIFRRTDASTAVFGGFYGLCAWALGFQWNVMWLDTFALLPLVVLGAVALLGEKKYFLYTITLFLSVFINYYVGFFTCIFVLLLFFIYELCRWGGWKKFFLDLVRIAFFSALAIAMTAVLTLPALAALQTTQSSVNQFPTSFRLNIASSHDLMGLLDAMRQVAGNMGGALEPNFKEGLPNVYCGIFSIMLLFLYLMERETRLRDKICAVLLLIFLILSFIIRQLDYIWHGFHFTNMIPYRFSFLYSFVVLYMAYRAWTKRLRYRTWQILLAGVLAAGVLACSNSLRETVPVAMGNLEFDCPVYFLYNLLFLLLYVTVMLSGRVRYPLAADAGREERIYARMDKIRTGRRTALLLLTVMIMELAANLTCFGLYFTGTGISNYPRGTEKTASVIRYMWEREEGKPFFRAETAHSQTLNDGALNGYNGVSAFTSSANVKTTLFMQALGYGAKNTYNRYLFEESSPVANLFLDLKYMLERDGKDKQSRYFTLVNEYGSTGLYQNEAWLPLGFLTESTLAELSFEQETDAFRFQNNLFCSATGMQEYVWQRLEGEALTITANGVNISGENGLGYCKYSDAASGSSVTYTFQVPSDGFACIRLDLPKRNDYYISINDRELLKESISLPQMMAVGDVQAGDTFSVRIVCKDGESSTMNVTAGILNPDVFERGYQKLNECTLDVTDFCNTRVAGTIACNRDGLLYTSIPQNGNWSVLVDGVEAEIRLVGDCMIGVPLTQGSHTVTFVYRNPALTLGLAVSLCSAGVLAVLLWLNRKKRK